MEVILALATFALLITGMIGAYLYGEQTIAFGGNLSRASLLAEEGLEAARNIRDEDFQSLTSGNYGLSINANQWILSGDEDQEGIFKRQISINDVDSDRKRVTSIVNWDESGKTKQVSLETELTYWRKIVELTKNWIDVYVLSYLNISTENAANKVAASDHYAYLIRASGSPNFVVVDIGETIRPTLVGSLNLSAGINNIFITGNYAYLASSSNTAELQIIDISNPTNPNLIGAYNDPGNEDANGVYVVNDRAYLALSGGNDFVIVNVANPKSPKSQGTLTLSGEANDLIVRGNNAYVAVTGSTKGLQVIDISNSVKPILKTFSNLSGIKNLLCIADFDNTLATGGSGGELNLIDITDPLIPKILASYGTNGTIKDIAIDGSKKFAFLTITAENNEFEIVSIGDSASLQRVSGLDLEYSLNGVSYSINQEMVLGASSDPSKELLIFSSN